MLVPALLAVPICLAARFVSVAVPVTAMRLRGVARDAASVPVLTWSGLRGGISVALVLALPRFAGKESAGEHYAVVVFSVLVQGLTVRRVLVHYGVGQERGT